jgi:hypothetical protein
MMRHAMMRKHFGIPFFLTILLAVNTQTQSTGSSQPYEFLRKYFNISHADFYAADQGKVVTRILKTTEKREVAAFGIVHLKVPVEFFLSKYRDIVNFKKDKAILQIGKFSQPPRMEDLKNLVIPAEDLKSIQNCEIGDCDLKLSSEWIQAFQRLDKSASNYKNQISELFRRLLFNYVTAYSSKGNQGMIRYQDKKTPLMLSQEFRSILQHISYLREHAPELQNYLENYSGKELADSENFIYWSKEKVAFKAIISVTHVTISRPKSDKLINVQIATKQIYASHYFDGSLGLPTLIADKDGTGMYLIYQNRSRADQLKGAFSGLKRVILERRVVKTMKESLERTKKRLEEEYRASTRQ